MVKCPETAFRRGRDTFLSTPIVKFPAQEIDVDRKKMTSTTEICVLSNMLWCVIIMGVKGG
jgi:hypothetical protein